MNLRVGFGFLGGFSTCRELMKQAQLGTLFVSRNLDGVLLLGGFLLSVEVLEFLRVSFSFQGDYGCVDMWV